MKKKTHTVQTSHMLFLQLPDKGLERVGCTLEICSGLLSMIY